MRPRHDDEYCHPFFETAWWTLLSIGGLKNSGLMHPPKSLFPIDIFGDSHVCDLQSRAMAMEHLFHTKLFVGYPFRYQK